MPGHPVSDAWDSGVGNDIRDNIEQYNATIVQSVDAITSRSWALTKFIILVSGNTVSFYEYDPDSVAAHDGVNVIKDTDDRAFVLRGQSAGGADGDDGADGVDGTSIMTRVRAVDTTGLDPSTDYQPGDTIDGKTLAENDIVLRAESDASSPNTAEKNGAYVVPSSTSPPTPASRHSSFNTYDSMPGCYFSVMEGTSYADTLWRCTSDKGGTLDTTALVFSQFQGGAGPVQGTTTNDNAAAGYVGEIIESEILAGSAVTLFTATPADITSIELTAGDWDVFGNVRFVIGSGATMTVSLAGPSTASATNPTPPNAGAMFVDTNSYAAGKDPMHSFGTRRYSLSGTTTVYLVGYASFSGGTVSAYGYIGARRVR